MRLLAWCPRIRKRNDCVLATTTWRDSALSLVKRKSENSIMRANIAAEGHMTPAWTRITMNADADEDGSPPT